MKWLETILAWFRPVKKPGAGDVAQLALILMEDMRQSHQRETTALQDRYDTTLRILMAMTLYESGDVTISKEFLDLSRDDSMSLDMEWTADGLHLTIDCKASDEQ